MPQGGQPRAPRPAHRAGGRESEGNSEWLLKATACGRSRRRMTTLAPLPSGRRALHGLLSSGGVRSTSGAFSTRMGHCASCSRRSRGALSSPTCSASSCSSAAWSGSASSTRGSSPRSMKASRSRARSLPRRSPRAHSSSAKDGSRSIPKGSPSSMACACPSAMTASRPWSCRCATSASFRFCGASSTRRTTPAPVSMTATVS